MKNTRNLNMMMIGLPLLACCCVLIALKAPFGSSAWVCTLLLSLVNAGATLAVAAMAEKAEPKNAVALILLGKGIKSGIILAIMALYMILLPQADRTQLIFPFGAAYVCVLLMETFIKTKKNPINLKEKVLS